MSCCKNYLGEFPHNAPVKTGLLALQAGKHLIILEVLSCRYMKEVTLAIGEEIIIPLPFNENYNYTFTIQQPDGSLYSGAYCTNFGFKTYVNITDGCAGLSYCDYI